MRVSRVNRISKVVITRRSVTVRSMVLTYIEFAGTGLECYYGCN